MKRKILCLLLAVALIVAMALPAFAAELPVPDGYAAVGDPYVWTNGDAFSLTLTNGYYLIGYGLDGVQYIMTEPVWFDFEKDTVFMLEFESVPVNRSTSEVSFSTFVLTFDPYSCAVEFIRINGAYTQLPIMPEGDEVLLDSFSIQQVEPVGSSASGNLGLSDVVDGNMLSGVFNEFIAILPVSLGALVTFIGLRKAIAWVKSIVYGA